MVDEPTVEISEIVRNEDEYEITLRSSEQNFRRFIAGLLGQPQLITGKINESFEVDIAKIINFHHTINQRISEQNQGFLLQFRATISFSDMTSALINSISELQSFEQVRQVATTSIELNWVFLIKFANRDSPERQEVAISLITERHYDTDILDRFVIGPGSFSTGRGPGYQITHTARTWGADIQSLLENLLRSLTTPQPAIFRYTNRGIAIFSKWFSPAVRIAAMCLVFISLANTFDINYNWNSLLLATHSNGSTESITLSTHAVSIVILCFVYYGILSVILEVLEETDLFEHFFVHTPSYILITTKDIDQKEKITKSSKKAIFNATTKVVVAVLCGIIANAVFFIIAG
jgi:hypothetical protein